MNENIKLPSFKKRRKRKKNLIVISDAPQCNLYDLEETAHAWLQIENYPPPQKEYALPQTQKEHQTYVTLWFYVISGAPFMI